MYSITGGAVKRFLRQNISTRFARQLAGRCRFWTLSTLSEIKNFTIKYDSVLEFLVCIVTVVGMIALLMLMFLI